MKLMLELSHSEDELNLDITRGAARANLDAMLFEEIDGDPDEQYVKITSGSADTRHSCRTPAGIKCSFFIKLQCDTDIFIGPYVKAYPAPGTAECRVPLRNCKTLLSARCRACRPTVCARQISKTA